MNELSDNALSMVFGEHLTTQDVFSSNAQLGLKDGSEIWTNLQSKIAEQQGVSRPKKEREQVKCYASQMSLE